MAKLRVFVGMETSGRVREAMRARGHVAVSCDLLPSDDGSPHHIQGDVMAHILDWRPDLAILHPTCRYLANSGALRLYLDGKKANGPDPDRWARMREAAEFFRRLLCLPIPRLAIENPVMHGHALAIIGQGPSQSIQPYDFGEDASKRTCLWLHGLPRLVGTAYFPPRMVDGKPRWGNQTDGGQNKLPPSDDRWKLRSVTYQGIADAMAAQWTVSADQLEMFARAAA